MRRAWLARAGLVDADLHAFDLRLRAYPERAFDPSEVFESQPESRCSGVTRLREGHHSTLPPLLQADDQLEAPAEVSPAPVGGREKQQPVAVFPWQHVGFYLETVDGERLSVTFFRCEHLLNHRQFLAHAHV